jgi:pyruvate carboxylase
LTSSFIDNEEYLFVYGTLRSQMNDPLHRLLEKHAVLVATGSFQGKLYDLGRYPGAIPSHGKTDRVLGEIYRFSESQRALEILDEYEGHRFKRQRVTIVQENGKSIPCWIYLYARSVRHRARISSGDYIRYRNSV